MIKTSLSGHGPYSHLYEVLVRRANEDSKWTHEQSSLDMLDLIIESKFCKSKQCNETCCLEYNIDLADYNLDETDLEFIKELINGKKFQIDYNLVNELEC